MSTIPPTQPPSHLGVQTQRFTFTLRNGELPTYGHVAKEVGHWIESPLSPITGTLRQAWHAVTKESVIHPGGHAFPLDTDKFIREAERIAALPANEKLWLVRLESAVLYGKMLAMQLYEMGVGLISQLVKSGKLKP